MLIDHLVKEPETGKLHVYSKSPKNKSKKHLRKILTTL
jgi:hypothetical protein